MSDHSENILLIRRIHQGDVFAFNEFYHKCQVIGKDKNLMSARLKLVAATKYVLGNSLMLLGIEAPEKM